MFPVNAQIHLLQTEADRH